MTRRLILKPGTGITTVDSNQPTAKQISVSSDLDPMAAVQTSYPEIRNRSVSPVYTENGKPYIDVLDEQNGWVQLELSDTQVAAYSAGQSVDVSNALLLTSFDGNTAQGAVSGAPTFAMPPNKFTFYGPFVKNGTNYIAIWIGSEWKYINLDNDQGIGTGNAAVTVPEWQPFTLYTDEVITYQNRLYKCVIINTSGSSFDIQYWHEFVGGVTAHTQLTGLNDDPLFQHVKSSDMTKWNTYDATIKLLQQGTPSSSITIANDTVNGQQAIDHHSISQLKFAIGGTVPTDTVVLNDISKISAVPSNIIGGASVSQIAGAWYLTVTISNLNYGQSCSVAVGTGCVLINGTLINSNTVLCSWKNATALSQPVIGHSTTDGRFGVDPTTLNTIAFPVTCSSGTLALQLGDTSAWSCTPTNIVVGAPVVNTLTNTVVFTVANAQLDTQYTITANAGLVSNGGYTSNTSTSSASFGTTLSTPVVGTSPDDGNNNVDGTITNKYITFPITTASGHSQFDIADATKISISGATSAGVSIVSGNLKIYYIGGTEGSTIVFTVSAGAIKNYNSLGDLVNNVNTSNATIQFLVTAPIVSVPMINGNQDVDYATTSVLVPYTSNTVATIDQSKISSTPSNLVTGTSLTTVGAQSYLVLSFASLSQNQVCSFVLAAGVLKASGTIPNVSPVSFSFRCKASEPVVTQSVLNGTSVNASVIQQVTFNVTGTDTLTVADATKIVMTPNAITGTITLASNVLTIPVTLVSNTNYTLTVGSGSVKNRNTTNTASTICTFATATTFSVGQSSTNGSRVPTTTTFITFPLNNVNGVASVADLTKITASGCTLGSPSIAGSVLTVPISGLSNSTTVSVSVAAGAVRDNIMLNTNPITCMFTTAGNVPIVSASTLNNTTKVATNTSFTDFPVTASGTVTIANAALITSSPAGLISNSVIVGSLGSYKLRTNFNAMSAGTQYTITVAIGAISNDGTITTSSTTSSFKTLESAPAFTQTGLNLTYQDAPFTTITYAVTSGSACTVADISKITVSGGPTISDVVISGSNVVVTLSGTAVDQTIIIGILAGLIANGDLVANTSTISSTIYTKGDIPVIVQSTANGQNSLPISPAYIEYAVTASGTVTIADANKVTVSPNVLQSVSMVSGKLRVTLNVVNNTSYTVSIAAGLLVNAQTLSTGMLTTTFKTVQTSPVIGQSATNGATAQALTLNTISFPITSTGTLSVSNASMVSAVNASISSVTVSGSTLSVAFTGLTYSKSVSITVGAGTVTNGDATNANSVTCAFTTLGSLPVVGQSTTNGTVIAKTTSYIDFPVTGVSGTLAIANSAKVYAPTGSDNIVTSSAISGSNLRVTLNTGAMVFNKAYRIQVDAGAVSNDGVASTNDVTCNLNTTADVPVVGQSSTNGTQVATSFNSVSFPITAGSIAGTFAVSNASAITGTNCTVTGTNISGSNLVVSVSGLTNSSNVSVVVGAGALSNAGVVNMVSRTCAFTTLGALVGIAQSVTNGSTTVPLATTYVDYILASPTNFGTMSVDNLKVLISPNVKSASAFVINNSGVQTLRVPVANLQGTTAYTLTISSGAISNDGTLSADARTTTFTTASGTATRPVLWEFQFTYPNAAINMIVSNQPGWNNRVLTSEDIYGPAYDGAGAMAELRWYGYVGNLSHPEGVILPRDGFDPHTSICPDEAYSFDEVSDAPNTWIYTVTGSPSAKVYKFIKYSA